MHPLLSDSQTWIDNFWLPLLVLGVAGVIGWWFKARGQRRYGADAGGRLLVSRAFTATATQMGALRLYTPGKASMDGDVLVDRIAECLGLLHGIAFGEAAKTARNAGDARFNRFETNVVSFTVGNIQGFVDAYLHFQDVHNADPSAPLPTEALDLRRWERSYRSASKVLDPNKLTPLGYAWLGNRACVLVQEVGEAMGHQPVRKTGLIRRLLWLRNL